MFIIVFLLTVLSIPRALLKPTVVESEFDDTPLDDKTRAKRQAEFFELLHQAIDKYANCANEHLAPLRALANYKQYETFVYPENYRQPQKSTVGATNNRNKPKVKCTKVNLCSIQPPQAQSNPKFIANTDTLLGRTQDSKSEVPTANRQYFPYKANARLPQYGTNRSRNMQPVYRPRYSYGSGSKNFTSFPLNRNFFHQLFNGQGKRKGVVITPTQDPKGETILGSANFSDGFKSCNCNKSTNLKPPTTIGNLKEETPRNSEKKEGIEKSSTTTTTEAGPILANIQNNSTQTAKPKGCGCLKKTTSKSQVQQTSTTSEPLLGSSNAYKTDTNQIQNSSTARIVTDTTAHTEIKEAHSNQNLNLLFLQLDIMAHNESKEDLKQILQKLNALKSALNIKEPSNDKMEATTTFSSSTIAPITTVSPTTLKSFSTLPSSMTSSLTSSSTITSKVFPLVGDNESESHLVAAIEPVLDSTAAKVQGQSLFITKTPEIVTSTAKVQESIQVTTKEPEIVTKIASVLTKNENPNTTKTLNDDVNLQVPKNNTHINQIISKTENSNIESNKVSINNTAITHSAQKSGKNSSSLLNALEDFSHKLIANASEEDITVVTSSPPLDLNITNSQDLARITNEMHKIVDSMANKTMQGKSEQQLTKSGNITIIKKTIISANNKTFSGANNNTINGINLVKLIPKDHTQNLNLLVTNLNNTVVPHTLNHTNNGSFTNSTITISISSNGNFKKIQVEQQSPSDKNLEINEKENMNMGTSKTRPLDMKATDSRHVKYVKNPLRKDSYTEPILSEIYPSKTKLKTKTPLSFYWHKIEEKPLKIKKIPSKTFKIFQSDDYDDDDEDDEENDREAEENLSILLKECDDFEDLTDYEDSDSEEDDHKTRFRDLCQHINYFT